MGGNVERPKSLPGLSVIEIESIAAVLLAFTICSLTVNTDTVKIGMSATIHFIFMNIERRLTPLPRKFLNC
jgi:hypothetical protein